MEALRTTINTQSIKTKQIVFQYPDGRVPEAGAILNVTNVRGNTDWTRAPHLDSIALMDTSGNEGLVTFSNERGLLVNNISVGGGTGSGIQKIDVSQNLIINPLEGNTPTVSLRLADALTGLTGVSVTGNLSAGGNVDASGNGNFGGDLDVDGRIDASSALIQGRLETLGFLKAVTAEVTGDTNIGGLLMASAGVRVTAGDISAEESTLWAQYGNFSNGLTVNNTVTATGTVNIGENLNVDSDICGDTLYIAHNADISGDMRVDGLLTASGLEIDNAFRVTGELQAGSGAIDTNLNVLGDLTIVGTFNHSGSFNPPIVSDICAGEGIVISHPVDQPSVFIITAPLDGGGDEALYDAGQNISLTGDNPFLINVAINADLDMNLKNITNVGVVQLATTAENALDPRISFMGQAGTEQARIEYNDSNIVKPELRLVGPRVIIDTSGGIIGDAAINLNVGTGSLSVTNNRVTLGDTTVLDISGIVISCDGIDLKINNTLTNGGYKIDGIEDVSGDSGYAHILAYNNTSGMLRKIPMPDDVDISGGINISVDKVGIVTNINLEITENVDMAKQRLIQVGGIDLSGGSAIDVSGQDLTLSSGGTSFMTLKGNGGILLEGVGQASVANSKVLGYNQTTNAVELQDSNAWINQYLLSQPGALTNQTTAASSAEILLTWTNPPQLAVSFQAAALPNIAAMKVIVNADGTVTTYTNTASLPGSVSAASAVTGVVFIKNTGVNGIVSRTPSGGTPVNVFAIYLGTGYTSTFATDIWYEGYGDTSTVNKLTVSGLAFTSGGPPSVVRNVGSNSVTSSTVTITYTAPLYSDASNNLTPPNPAITGYNITYTPTGNAKRFNGAFNTTPVLVSAGTALSKALTGLYPDTSYSVGVTATNSFGLTGPAGTPTTTLTMDPCGGLVPTQYINSFLLDFTAAKYAASTIYVNVTQLVLTNSVYYAPGSAQLTINPIGPLPIHVFDTRGSSADGIMNLSATLNTNPTTLSVGGFNTTTGSITGSVNIDPSGSRVNVGTAEYSGFYQKERYQFTTSAYDTNRSQLNTLTLIQSFPDTSVTDKSNTLSFYTDTLTPGITPMVTDIAATISSPNTLQISGLTVTTAATISGIGYTAAGMSNTFSTSGSIRYSIGNIGLTTLVDILPNTVAGNTYTASSQTTGALSFTGYFLRPPLTIQAKNTNGLTGSGTQTMNILIDKASVDAGANNATRYRSPLAAVKNSTNSGDYTPAAYDNTQSVIASGSYGHECLLVQGNYVGKGTSGAFVDYSAGSIGPNLSGTNGNGTGGFTSGYRYVTFQRGGGSGAVSTLTLTITFNSASLATAANVNRQKLQVSGTDIDVYFRTVGTTTTRWINANSYENGDNLNALFPIGSAGTDLGTQKENGLTIAGSVVTYSLFIPTAGGFSADNTYVTIGIPDSASIGVSTITCTYS